MAEKTSVTVMQEHGHSIRSTLPRAELTACLHVLHPMQAAEHLIFWQTAQRLQVSRQSTPADGRNGPHWKHSRSNWKQEFHTLRIEFTESGSNLNWLHFVRQSEYIENLEKLYQAWAKSGSF